MSDTKMMDKVYMIKSWHGCFSVYEYNDNAYWKIVECDTMEKAKKHAKIIERKKKLERIKDKKE